MLDKFAAFLGTDKGFWLTMALTVICGVIAFFNPDIATFVLSVVAIVLPSVILVRDNHQRCVAEERDKAMHKKLDALIDAIPDADDELQHSEPDHPSE